MQASKLVHLGLVALSLCACDATMSSSARPTLALTDADRIADPSCDAAWVAGLTGRVLDADHRPFAGAYVQPCLALGADGGNVCLEPTQTLDDGTFGIVLDPSMRCLERVAIRTLATPRDGRAWGVNFALPDLVPIDAVLDARDDIVLFAIEGATSHTPMGDGMQRLSFPAGVELELRPSDLEDPAMFEYLALARVSLEQAPAFAAELPGLHALYNLGPESSLSPAARFSVAVEGLAEGSRVELFLAGGVYTELVDGTLVPEAEFVRFGEGSVRDGVVVPDEGAELPYLSWLGIRPLAR